MLPVAEATVNLLVAMSKSPSIPVAPVTSNVPPTVVLLVTANVPPIVALLVTLKPVPLPFESVRVSYISAVLLRSRAPVNVVPPVTLNVPPTVAAPPMAVVELATVA